MFDCWLGGKLFIYKTNMVFGLQLKYLITSTSISYEEMYVLFYTKNKME